MLLTVTTGPLFAEVMSADELSVALWSYCISLAAKWSPERKTAYFFISRVQFLKSVSKMRKHFRGLSRMFFKHWLGHMSVFIKPGC
jgi:hypothetical protein